MSGGDDFDRVLIVNADDFGLSAGVNAGVVKAHEEGVVTSASLMVDRGGSDQAAAYARSNPALALGLHFDLGEWRRRDGRWVVLYEVVPLEDAPMVEQEVRRQLEAFRNLVGRDPTHLDSHQHVHRGPVVSNVFGALGAELGVPVRDLVPHVRYTGDFYGQDERGEPYLEAIEVESLIALIARLGQGVTELGCHPAATADTDSVYGPEREVELRTLCDPQVADAITAQGIALRSFAELRTLHG